MDSSARAALLVLDPALPVGGCGEGHTGADHSVVDIAVDVADSVLEIGE